MGINIARVRDTVQSYFERKGISLQRHNAHFEAVMNVYRNGEFEHEIQRIIAHGSQGIVGEFNDGNRRRALKICIAPTQEKPNLLTVFAWETLVTRNLVHESIIVPAGRPFLQKNDVSKDFPEGAVIAFTMRLADCNLEEEVLQEAENIAQQMHVEPPIALLAEKLKRYFADVARALVYLHNQGLAHRDIKETNILVFYDKSGIRRAALCDFGCARRLHGEQGGAKQGGGVGTESHRSVRATSSNPGAQDLVFNDLFGLSLTMHRMLKLIQDRLGKRVRAVREIRELYTIAALIGGSEAQSRAESNEMFRFKPPAQISGAICDVLCPPTAEEALRLLTNTRRTLLDSPLLPELFGENLATINVFPETGVPFSARINSLVSHATFQRLKCELQLGWISQVFPGALHTRWVHSLGVFNIVRRIYVALISDEFNPIAAVYLQLSDVANALVAALIHDLGQTAFAHAIEEVDTALYKHEEATVDLLDETCHLTAGQPSLWGVIQRDWSSVGISKQRILYICGSRLAGSNYGARDLAVDSLARDLVAGVIDGDRLDYLRRDSLNCGVPYGNSVDIDRLLSSLSVAVENKPQLRLGFDAKGLSAIESLLWARYQMFNAVYWHHTYRGIQALFFAALEGVRFCSLDAPAQHRFFYQYVVLRQSRRIVQSEVLERMNPVECAARFDEVEALTEDRALHFVFVLGNSRSCELVRRLACRNYYKVIFERRVRSYIEAQMPSTRRVPEKLKAGQRTAVAERIGRQFIERINAERNQRKAESMSEMAAFATLDIQSHVPWVLLDFPTRGNTPDQVGFPLEIPNVSRKYGQLSAEVGDNGSIFLAISRFLFESSWVRVYVEPVLHSLITDYLTEDTVAEVIGKEIKGELFTKP